MNKLYRILPPLFVFLFVFALFAPSIAYPLVPYDDPSFIARNRLVLDGLSWNSLKDAFTILHADTAMYSPLLWISWMADVSLFRASVNAPWPFHFGNVLLHALNAVLLFCLLRRCRASSLAAALLALLWACHPLRVESVAWITERKDTLSTLFAFLSILFYLKAFPSEELEAVSAPSIRQWFLVARHSRKGFFFLSFFAFLLGLLVKPMLVTLPFLFLLFDVFPLRRIALDRTFSFSVVLRLVVGKWSFFFLSAVASVLSFFTQTHAIQHDATLLERLSAVPLHYAFYLVKTFRPVRLSPFYYPIAFSWQTFVPVALLFATLFVSAWRRRLSAPAWSLGILAFFGLFVPVIGFFHVGIHHVADRYSYLPAIGLSIAILPLCASSVRPLRLTANALAALALLALCPLTLRALPLWSSGDALYEGAARVCPDHPFVAAWRAHTLISRFGDFAAAEPILDNALADNPDSDFLRIPKALCIARRSSPGDAFDYLMDRSPEALTPHELREAAQYALRSGNHRAVPSLVETALSTLPPDDSLCEDLLHLLFASALLSGNQDLMLRTADRIPDFAGRTAFGEMDLFPYYVDQWFQLHREDAWAYFRASAWANLDSPPSLNNLAWLLATTPGWNPAPPSEVLSFASRAAELAPEHPVILDTLAAAFANASDFSAAAETARRSLGVAAPDTPLANGIRSRLALYLQDKPFREQTPLP